MHRLFRKALNNATGESKSIIAVIFDIRDFSGFSQRCDSVNVAAFIMKVYMKMIDEYFPFVSFYKSTGDGLLLTIPWGEKNLEEISQKVIASCINCHSEFANICSGDPAINFKVPDKIGIGVARGSACRLVSGNRVIDYAGRLLNLTSRLTDLARPSGIILDGAFVIGLLTEEQQKLFKKEKVYLKGISEDKPMIIYYTKKFTVIPKYNKHPIASERWREVAKSWSYGKLLKLKPLMFVLPSKPVSADEIDVIVTHDVIRNGKVDTGYEHVTHIEEFIYQLEKGKPGVIVDLPKLCRRLKRRQLKEGMQITVTVAYVEK